MQQNEKVSVIIPVYNVQKYLPKCIESILSQTYNRFEVILVNDGSKDNSIEICREYEAKDIRIVVIDKVNEGAAIARNTGLDAATGDYILFVDSDDWIENNMIEQLVSLIGEAGADLSICSHYIENPDGSDRNLAYNSKEPVRVYKNIGECIAALDDTCKFPYLWDRLYKRNIIEDNNIKFEEQFISGEDMDFNFKYFSHIKSCVVTSVPLYHYVKHGTDTLCSKYKPDLYESVIELNKRRKQLYEKHYMLENAEFVRVFEKMYIEQISTCIPNLFRKNTPYKIKEKFEIIKTIIKNKELKEYCNRYSPSYNIGKVFKNVVKINSSIFAVVIYSLLFMIRNNNLGLYQSLRNLRRRDSQ